MLEFRTRSVYQNCKGHRAFPPAQKKKMATKKDNSKIMGSAKIAATIPQRFTRPRGVSEAIALEEAKQDLQP